MWNTGVNVVYNQTAKRWLKIVDGEDERFNITIDPGGQDSLKGVVLPWAANDNEVTSKSFKVKYRVDGVNAKWKGWFFMFQDYHTDLACWVDWTSASPYQDGKANATAAKASYVDININIKPDDEGNLTVPVVEFVKVW